MKLLASKIQENIRVLSYEGDFDVEEIKLAPISDLHIGSPEFKETKVLEFLKYCSDNGIYLLLLGDLLNLDLKESIGNVYEAKLQPQECIDYAINLLRPFRNLILGVLAGNHELRVSKSVGIDVVKTICECLDIGERYSDSALYLYLQFGKNEHGRKFGYKIYALHGWGAGRSNGSKVNNADLMGSITDANCCILAHGHIQEAHTNGIFTFDIRTKNLRRVKQLLVNSGSFAGYTKYAVRKGYKVPVEGCPIIHFGGKKRFMRVELVVIDD